MKSFFIELQLPRRFCMTPEDKNNGARLSVPKLFNNIEVLRNEYLRIPAISLARPKSSR